MPRRSSAARPKAKPSPRRWSQRVTETSNALDLEAGVFRLDDPAAIARSLKRSAERSRRRKADPFRSAMSMLVFYLNRAGKGLPVRRRRVLEAAKSELRALYAKPRRRSRSPGGRALRALPILLILAGAGAAAAEPREDAYVLGYAAAVIERELALGEAEIAVEDGVVFVRAERADAAEREKLERVLGELEGVSEVRIIEADEPGATRAWRALRAATPATDVVAEDGLQLFPREDLFDPLLADPRWPHFSAAAHHYDESGGGDELSWAAPVSFGETIPLVGGPAFADGRFELALHAGVFSIFDLDSDSFDLLNSDFLVGVAATWRRGDLSVMGRLMHQSSHLGDELLLRRDPIERVNLSYEALELLVSYDLGDAFRLYGGGGYLVHRDPSDLERWAWQLGAEAESPRTFWEGTLRPIAAIDLQSREETDWDLDLSVRAGFQIESSRWSSQRVQLLLEYYDGHSPNGQFFEREIRYLGVGAHLYF